MDNNKQYLVQHLYHYHSDIGWRVTFVASIMPGYDWAVYVSASTDPAFDNGINEVKAVETTLTYGNKLSENVAKAMFPSVTERYRP